MTRTTIRMLATLPALGLLASCLSKVDEESGTRDSASTSWQDDCYAGVGDGETGYSGDTDDTDVGDLRGTGGIYIVEADCDIARDISGPSCSGCDLGWDLDLVLTGAGSCSFGDNTSGTFEVFSGAAYFEGDYWGAASAGGGTVVWATAGYVYGVGGYTYYYSGSGTY